MNWYSRSASLAGDRGQRHGAWRRRSVHVGATPMEQTKTTGFMKVTEILLRSFALAVESLGRAELSTGLDLERLDDRLGVLSGVQSRAKENVGGPDAAPAGVPEAPTGRHFLQVLTRLVRDVHGDDADDAAVLWQILGGRLALLQRAPHVRHELAEARVDDLLQRLCAADLDDGFNRQRARVVHKFLRAIGTIHLPRDGHGARTHGGRLGHLDLVEDEVMPDDRERAREVSGNGLLLLVEVLKVLDLAAAHVRVHVHRSDRSARIAEQAAHDPRLDHVPDEAALRQLPLVLRQDAHGAGRSLHGGKHVVGRRQAAGLGHLLSDRMRRVRLHALLQLVDLRLAKLLGHASKRHLHRRASTVRDPALHECTRFWHLQQDGDEESAERPERFRHRSGEERRQKPQAQQTSSCRFAIWLWTPETQSLRETAQRAEMTR
eukprot:scaffold1944_cov241-Pinguiococcus_pyrenoidosus.AAC.26